MPSRKLNGRRSAAIISMGAIVLTTALVACSESEPSGPIAPPELAGDYVATTLIVTAPDHTRDLLEDGSTFEITLSANLAVTGRLHIPETPGEPELDRQIEGLWTYDPITRTARIQEQTPTFVSDLRLIRGDNALGPTFSATLLQPAERLNHSSPITRIDLVLERPPPPP